MVFLILRLFLIYYQQILTSITTRLFFYKLVLGSWFMSFFLSNRFKSIFKLLKTNRKVTLISLKKKVVKKYKKLMMSYTNMRLISIFSKLERIKEMLDKQKLSFKQKEDNLEDMVNLKAYKNNVLI